jgi:hypothetical protein
LNVKLGERIPFGALSLQKKKTFYEKLMLQDFSCGPGLFRKKFLKSNF